MIQSRVAGRHSVDGQRKTRRNSVRVRNTAADIAARNCQVQARNACSKI